MSCTHSIHVERQSCSLAAAKRGTTARMKRWCLSLKICTTSTWEKLDDRPSFWRDLMANKFQSLREGMSQERRDRIDAMTKEMLAEIPMHGLRDALRFTQQQLGRRQVDQAS